tara:strand:+ start:5608 stop:7326 length:1719 start_codon:yes stop_codon:yes gene_type:complete
MINSDKNAAYTKILSLFPKKFKKKSLIFIFLSIFASFLETLSIGLIFPLIDVLIKGDFSKNYFGIDFDNFFSFFEGNSVTINLILFILFFYLFKCVFLIFFNYWQLKFSQSIYKYLSLKLLKKYLNNSISFYHKNNSSVLIRNVMFETKNYGTSISIIFKLIIEIFIILLVFGLVIYLEPKISLSIILILGFFVLLFYFLTSKRIYFFGNEKILNVEKAIKIVSETFGGIRDIKLKASENYFFELFKNFLGRFVKVSNYQQAITDAPKILFEFLLVATFLISLVLYLRTNSDITEFLSIIGLYIVASLRLVPAVMRILNMLQTIRGLEPSINMLNNELNYEDEISSSKILSNNEEVNFKSKIEFDNLTFSYNLKNVIFENFSEIIKKNEITGISGKSGAGKSTLVDLLTGLLRPTKGKIIIDNKFELGNSSIKSWQKRIGYVSQSVFLLDATIRENIAFGVDKNKINENKIIDALNDAEIYNFVLNLDNKLDTVVGERGVKLSGGQIQRIGIARELYRNPELIIFDESTSALDEKTENQIIECIKKLKGKITTVIISHRDNMLKICDKIIRI